MNLIQVHCQSYTGFVMQRHSLSGAAFTNIKDIHAPMLAEEEVTA